MNVYEIITNRIIEQLEAGEIAWKKPWNAKTQAPRNLGKTAIHPIIYIHPTYCLVYSSPRISPGAYLFSGADIF